MKMAMSGLTLTCLPTISTAIALLPAEREGGRERERGREGEREREREGERERHNKVVYIRRHLQKRS